MTQYPNGGEQARWVRTFKAFTCIMLAGLKQRRTALEGYMAEGVVTGKEKN